MCQSEENPLISIIIPVYNVEKYLPECLESVLQQTYRKLEVILVDDGSTDLSGEICDAFQKKDARIKVIHKENGGPTSARKAGISCASGPYVGFVDSDDWIDRDMYQVLMEAMLAEKADLVVSGIFFEYQNYTELCMNGIDAGVYQKECLSKLHQKMVYSNQFQSPGIIWSLYAKLFKTKTILPLLMEEDDALHHGEDVVCSCAYICESACVVVLERAFYHYRQRNGSIVHSKDPVYLENLNALYRYFRNRAEEGGYPPETVLQFNCFIFELCLRTPEYMFDAPQRIPTYIFPFDRIPSGARLILYGAGTVGKSYYNVIQWTNAFQVVGWIDRDYQRLQMENVSGLEILREKDCDYVVIAVQNESVAREIKESIRNQGVLEQKILWFKPRHLFEVLFQ